MKRLRSCLTVIIIFAVFITGCSYKIDNDSVKVDSSKISIDGVYAQYPAEYITIRNKNKYPVDVHLKFSYSKDGNYVDDKTTIIDGIPAHSKFAYVVQYNDSYTSRQLEDQVTYRSSGADLSKILETYLKDDGNGKYSLIISNHSEKELVNYTVSVVYHDDQGNITGGDIIDGDKIPAGKSVKEELPYPPLDLTEDMMDIYFART